MNILDLIIAAILFFGAVSGFRKGFFVELATLVAMIAGIYFGLIAMDIAGAIIEPLISKNMLIIKIIVFLIVFGLIAAIIHLTGELFTGLFKVMMLGLVNKIAGMFLGTLKLTLLISVSIVILDFFNLSENLIATDLITNSFFYAQIEQMNLLQYIANKMPQTF